MADAQHRVCFRFCRGIPRDADATGTAAVRRCTAVRGDGDTNRLVLLLITRRVRAPPLLDYA